MQERQKKTGEVAGSEREEGVRTHQPHHATPGLNPGILRNKAKTRALKLLDPPPDQLTDEQLEARAVSVAGRMSPRALRFVTEFMGGTTLIEAARRAGLSTVKSAPYTMAATTPVIELIRTLREQARRRAALTTVDAILRFQHLSRRAEEAGDLGVAVSADREAAKIAGLYPQEAGSGGAGPVSVTVALQLPQREIPPSFLVNAAARVSLPAPRAAELGADDPLLG